jgi:hypothetical protein
MMSHVQMVVNNGSEMKYKKETLAEFKRLFRNLFGEAERG